jgi:hypothetical protein
VGQWGCRHSGCRHARERGKKKESGV